MPKGKTTSKKEEANVVMNPKELQHLKKAFRTKQVRSEVMSYVYVHRAMLVSVTEVDETGQTIKKRAENPNRKRYVRHIAGKAALLKLSIAFNIYIVDFTLEH